MEEPQPPEPGECCGSGCSPCVWDLYYDKLEKYENWKEKQEQEKEKEKENENDTQDNNNKEHEDNNKQTQETTTNYKELVTNNNNSNNNNNNVEEKSATTEPNTIEDTTLRDTKDSKTEAEQNNDTNDVTAEKRSIFQPHWGWVVAPCTLLLAVGVGVYLKR